MRALPLLSTLMLTSLAAAAAVLPTAQAAGCGASVGGQQSTCVVVGPEAAPGIDQILAMVRANAPATLQAKGLALLAKAADAGDVKALVALASIRSEGQIGQPIDKLAAAELFGRAAAKGDNYARVQLALMLINGVGQPADLPRAVELLTDANADGDLWATTILAGLHVDGKVSQDGARVIEMLKPFVDAGRGEALTAMGDLYARGAAPVAPNPALARTYYEWAARLGDVVGKSRLGSLLVGKESSPSEVARGLGLLEEVARAGDAWTLIQIGNVHAAGEVVPVDTQKALAYYDRAAKAGLPAGNSLIGNVYRYGLGPLPRDLAKAASFYELAVAKEDNTARVQLSLMLLDGNGVDRDVPRAIELLEAAQKSGDVWSATILAGLYTDGKLVEADGGRALKFVESLAEAGNAAALTAMGDIFVKGPAPIKVARDRALGYYERAVALGDIGAKSRLGTILVARTDAAQDVSRGLALLEDVAAAGDGWTLIQIGHVYVDGEAVPLDATKALAYYERAAEGGIAAGYSLMGNVYRFGLGAVESDQRKAARFYEQAIEGEENTARVQLAIMLLEGEGVKQNVKRAIALLKDAADTGDQWATTILATLFADGRYVRSDYSSARGYFDAARKLGNETITLPFGLALATGPLAKKHAKEGISLVRSAMKDGVPDAIVNYARLQVAGRVPGENFRDADALLRKAVSSGDAASLRFLIELYRDGVPGTLAVDPRKVRSLLNRHGDMLTVEERAFNVIHVLAQRRAGQERFGSIVTEFGKLRPQDMSRTMQFLLWTDPNAFVYLVQRRLEDERLYRGPINGTLTNATLKAIGKACRRHGVAEICQRGVLTAEAADVFAGWLATTKMQ